MKEKKGKRRPLYCEGKEKNSLGIASQPREKKTNGLKRKRERGRIQPEANQQKGRGGKKKTRR